MHKVGIHIQQNLRKLEVHREPISVLSSAKTKQEAFSKQKEVTFIIQERMLSTVRLDSKISLWQQHKIFTVYLEGSSW